MGSCGGPARTRLRGSSCRPKIEALHYRSLSYVSRPLGGFDSRPSTDPMGRGSRASSTSSPSSATCSGSARAGRSSAIARSLPLARRTPRRLPATADELVERGLHGGVLLHKWGGNGSTVPAGALEMPAHLTRGRVWPLARPRLNLEVAACDVDASGPLVPEACSSSPRRARLVQRAGVLVLV